MWSNAHAEGSVTSIVNHLPELCVPIYLVFTLPGGVLDEVDVDDHT
jgi:hypothetical protein